MARKPKWPAPPPPPPQPIWTKICDEGRCVILDTARQIRYGVDTRWVYKTATGQAKCSAEFFGSDPAPGVVKSMEIVLLAGETPMSFIRAGRSASGASSFALSDIGGWTTYTPKTADAGVSGGLTSFANQTGSRIYYHDWDNGVDGTGEYLLWNGTALIDQTGSTTDADAVAYGTDPFNPQGARIKPYKSFGHTGPHRNGADVGTADNGDGDASQVGPLQFNLNAGRHGKPDWWLFKRGVTHPIYADLLAKRKITVPGDTNTNSSLSVPGGESTTYPSVVGAWGNPSLARPVIVAGGSGGFLSIYAYGDATYHAFKHCHYVSLTFDGHSRAADDATHTWKFSMLYPTSTAVNIAFEDCMFDGIGGISWDRIGTEVDTPELTFNRCLALYTWGTSGNVQWLFSNHNGDAKLRIKDRIAILNGYRTTDPSITIAANEVFDRCDYLTGTLDCTNSEMTNCLEMASGSASQIRSGMVVERNVWMTGGMTMGANGGNALSNSGTMKNNVLQKWLDVTRTAANPGYGIGLAFGAHDVVFSNNLVTDAGLSAADKAQLIVFGDGAEQAFSVVGTVPSWGKSMVNKTQDNTYSNNVSLLLGISTGVGHIGSDQGSKDTGQTAWTVGNTVTATAALSGVESCTLTAGWKGVTGSYTLTFSDTSTRTATLTNGNTAVSWTGQGNITATATITTPAFATWTVSGNPYFCSFPDVGVNTFNSTNAFVGGNTKVTFTKRAGATSPVQELTDLNTYTSGGGSLYADYAAFTAAVPAATDPGRTIKRYMQEVLGMTVTSEDGAVEMAAYAKANIRKGQYDPRFLGTAIGNWMRAGAGMTQV